MLALTRRNNNIANYYDPFRALEEFERSLFGKPFGGFMMNGGLAEFRTDITDEGGHYTLEADLPGFAKENIHLDLNGDTLTIKAERSSKTEDKDKQNKVIRCERSYGSYERQFDVSGIDTNGIKSKYEDGVLKLILPKMEQALPETRHLEIE